MAERKPKRLDVFGAAKALNDQLAAYNLTNARDSKGATVVSKRVAALINAVEIRTYNREERLELEVTPLVSQWPIVDAIIKTGKYCHVPTTVFERIPGKSSRQLTPPARVVKPTTPTA